jgi:hypothetical protein
MERRKFKRIRATVSLEYSAAGSMQSALTYDLSTHGCLIQTQAGLLQAGDELELTFGEDLAVKSRVVWVRQRNAGIQFETPLSVLAARRILFRVLGTGLQHALRGTSARLIARHLHPSLRWWPGRVVGFPHPEVRVAGEGAVRYTH